MVTIDNCTFPQLLNMFLNSTKFRDYWSGGHNWSPLLEASIDHATRNIEFFYVGSKKENRPRPLMVKNQHLKGVVEDHQTDSAFTAINAVIKSNRSGMLILESDWTLDDFRRLSNPNNLAIGPEAAWHDKAGRGGDDDDDDYDNYDDDTYYDCDDLSRNSSDDSEIYDSNCSRKMARTTLFQGDATGRCNSSTSTSATAVAHRDAEVGSAPLLQTPEFATLDNTTLDDTTTAATMSVLNPDVDAILSNLDERLLFATSNADDIQTGVDRSINTKRKK